MSSDCIFCKIGRREIPSHIVYDGDEAFAFLDIHPLARGHTLVVPKDHYERLENMPLEGAAKLMAAVRTVTPAVSQAVGAPATTIAINNGREGGQEVPHVHVHVVPRWQEDGFGPIHALFSNRPSLTSDDLAKLAEAARNNVV